MGLHWFDNSPICFMLFKAFLFIGCLIILLFIVKLKQEISDIVNHMNKQWSEFMVQGNSIIHIDKDNNIRIVEDFNDKA